MPLSDFTKYHMVQYTLQSVPKSKSLGSGNTTIAHCRPTHGTARKNHKTFTVTIHLKDNKILATSSLFHVQIIAKLESDEYPKQRPTQNPHKQLEVHKTIDQQQQNHRLRTNSSLSYRGLKCILLAPTLRPRFGCC